MGKKDKVKAKLKVGKYMMNVTYIPKKRSKNKNEEESEENSENAENTEKTVGPRISKGVIMKKGRHYCDCEGRLHEVITNCEFCGKIVCEQEGLGPCLFCEKEVTLENVDNISLGALNRRDKMVECDQNNASARKVIDDQLDYYDSNIWATKEEKKKRKKMIKKFNEIQNGIDTEKEFIKYKEMHTALRENLSCNSSNTIDLVEKVLKNPEIKGKFSHNFKPKKVRNVIAEEKRVQTEYFN